MSNGTNPTEPNSISNNDSPIIEPISYESYENWARTERNIAAPKIRISNNNNERGIVALETIHPNERIMLIPSSSLISQSNLNTICQDEFLITSNNTINDHEYAVRKAEYDSIVQISKIRKMVEENDGWGEWRSDDTIALFLICGRKIIDENGLPEFLISEEVIPTVETEVINSASSQPEEDDGVVVCCNAEPVTNQNTSSTTTCSSFLHHISVLPIFFPNIPLHFEADELVYLEGTNCHGYTTRMQYQIQSDWERLVSILQNYDSPWILTEEYFTLDVYKWALCNIFSRSTDFLSTASLDQEEPSVNTNSTTTTTVTRVIAPMFDFMNHNFKSQVYHSMDTSGNIYVFNGPDPILPREEVFLNYGNFPNEKLLFVYGFTSLPNPFDSVQLYAPIPPSDPLHAFKTNILLNQFQINHSDPDSLTLQSSLPSNLLTKLRITGVKDEVELLHLVTEHLGNQEEEEQKQLSFISVENEGNGLGALEYALYNMSRQIALNLIHDDNLNAGGIASSSSTDVEEQERENVQETTTHINQKDLNRNNAKILCSVEYQILISALNEVRECLGRLDCD